MIVQCPSCETKFRIADEKVTERGVRVRCTSCKSVFQAKKDGAELAAWTAPTGTTQELQSLSGNPALAASGAHGAADNRATADDLFGMDELTGEAKPLPGSALSSDPHLRPAQRAVSAPPPPPPDTTPSEVAPDFAAAANEFRQAIADPSPVKLATIKPTRLEVFDEAALAEVRPQPARAPEPAGRSPSAAVPKKSPIRRELVAVAMTGLIGAAMGLAAMALLNLSPKWSARLHGSKEEPLVATVLARGLYDTSAGKPIFFVLGKVENRGSQAAGPVRLAADLSGAAGLQLHLEGVAGTAPSAEQLRALRSTSEADALVRQLAESGAAVRIAPKASAPFFLLLTDPPAATERAELRLHIIKPDTH